MAPPLQIGVMLETVQLSDIACIDIIGNISTDMAEAIGDLAPPGFTKANAVSMVFHYISSSLSPTYVTPSINIVPTVTYDSCARDLDILVIGGPMPSHRPEGADRFLKEAFGVDGKGEAGKRVKTVLTTCTGSMWLASSGALDGKRATTNRLFLPLARELYPKVEWVDQRWVVHEDEDGRFWTSGGAAAGNDMVAQYALQTFHKEMVGTSLEGLDLDPDARGQHYRS